MIEYIGNFLSSPSSLAHCVTADFYMNTPVDVALREKYGMIDELRNAKKKGGDCAIIRAGEQYIYYLVTRENSSDAPSHYKFETAMKKARNHMLSFKVKEFAMMRMDDWDTRESIIRRIFKDCDIKIKIFE